MKRRANSPDYVVCISNGGYKASLVVRRIYIRLPDADAAKRGLIRVVDESGEDYLFPDKLFAEIAVPKAVERAF